MTDEKTLRRRAKQLRHRQTSAEALLWGLLRDRRLDGRKFRRQVRIANYIVDFLCTQARLIVEVDGATHSTPEQLSYDAERERVLSCAGYRILRVCNEDVYKRLPDVLTTVLVALQAKDQL